jgi:hypothetical protein
MTGLVAAAAGTAAYPPLGGLAGLAALLAATGTSTAATVASRPARQSRARRVTGTGYGSGHAQEWGRDHDERAHGSREGAAATHR